MKVENTFTAPDFSKSDLELKCINGEVLIYGNRKGIETLANLCLELLKKASKEHVHLEDYQVLTETSLKGVLAIFP